MNLFDPSKPSASTRHLHKAFLAALFFASVQCAIVSSLHAQWQRSTLGDNIAEELGMPNTTAIASDSQTHVDISQIQGYPNNTGGMQMFAAAVGETDEPVPEIKAIAAALNNNLGNILNWVTANIDFEPYNGMKRGARRTAIERSGNSFDIAALTIALLKAANIDVDAKYCFVTRYMTYQNASNWLGVAPDQVVRYLNDSGSRYLWQSGGLSYVDYAYDDGTSTQVMFPHVVVRITIAGVYIYVDPSYKNYIYNTGVSLASVTDFSGSAVLNAAPAVPATVGVGGASVSVITGNTSDKTGVRNFLTSHSGNYVTNILNSDNKHMLDGRQAAGGRRIDPDSTCQQLDTSGTPVVWSETDEFGKQFHVRMNVTVGAVTKQFDLVDLDGAKISVAFTNDKATLYADDVPVSGATEASSSGTTADVSISLVYANGVAPKPVTPAKLDRSGGPYVISYGFNNCLGMIKERMRRLASLQEEGFGATSNEIISENLHILGLQYLNEFNVINEVASSVLPARISTLHQVGIVGNKQVPYMDLPGILVAIGIRENGLGADATATGAIRDRAFAAATYWMSMLEHSLIEQLIITDAASETQYFNKGVSTVKMIQKYVESGNTPVYLARTSSEWSGLKNSSLLVGYTGTMLNGMDAIFATTATGTITVAMTGGGVLLPKTYAQSYNQYSGMGYVTMRYDSQGSGGGMILSGDLGNISGGVLTTNVPDNFYENSNPISLISSGASSVLFSTNNNTNNLLNYTPTLVNDPVDVSSGALNIDATDITVGQGAAPYGLAFTRHYSSLLSHSDPVGLGKGWTHNYDIRLTFRHAGDLDPARMTVAEVAPIMVATRAIYDSINITPTATAKNWVVPALVACWLGEQFVSTRAVMQMGPRVLEFVKLPDNTWAPPAGVKATLAKSGTNYLVKFRKGLQFTFDAADGRFRKITDFNMPGNSSGRSLSADYYPSTKRLNTVTDAHGRVLTFGYNAGDQLVSVSDGADRTVSYSQSAEAFAYTDPEGQVTTYRRDDKGRVDSIIDPVITIQDPNGRTTVTSFYDDFDRVIKQYSMGRSTHVWTYAYAPGITRSTDPDLNDSYYYFDAKGRKIAYVNENHDRTDWAYDGVGRTIATITPARQISWPGYLSRWRELTSYTYDRNHELIAITDPAGRNTTSEPSNDASTTPRYDTSPGGLVVRTDYHANIHLPSKVTKPGGITETFDEYDTYGRLKKYHSAAYAAGQYVTYAYTPATGTPAQVVATYPGGGTETTKFDTIGNVTETINRAGVKTTYTYNKRRQVTQTVIWSGTAAAQTSQVFYDAAGSVSYTIDPRGNQMDFSYNADGQLDLVTDALGNTMTNTYDLRNLLATTTDPLGFKTHNTYDAAMRLVSVKNALGHSGTTTYDPMGNVLSTKSALGHTSHMVYDDARFLVTTATDALGYKITYAYDDDGRQTSMTNRRGAGTNAYTTAYDDINRKITTTTPEGMKTTVVSSTRGLMDTTIRPSGKTVRNTSFDAEGRVLTQVIYSGTSQTTVLASSTMSYDAAGRLYQVKENGKTTTRTYDSLGRLSSYNDGEGHTMSYGYDAANNLVTLTYPGNLTVMYTYDANNQLESVTDWSNRTTTYTRDAAGRLRKTARPNGTVRKQVYDAVGQLRFIEERGATDVLMWMRALEYDADGRITSTHTWPSNTSTDYTALNASDSATYDNDNRIDQWSLGSGGSVNAVFDDDGNMTHGPAVNNPNSTGLGYQYDAHNRLTGVGGQANLYRYNPEGHRVEAHGVAYVIDPNAALSRTLMRVAGSTTTYYIWGANGLEYEITAGTTKTYHADHLGSTMLLTNDNGQPTGDYYEYDSYGTPTYRTGTASTPFQWHGTLGVTTENNGLVHMRARFYHPRIMRFVNEDPIGFQGGMNWYAFVSNNPLGFIDPLGLCRDNSGSGFKDQTIEITLIPGSGTSVDEYPYGNMTDADCGIALIRNIEHEIRNGATPDRTRDDIISLLNEPVGTFANGGAGMTRPKTNITAALTPLDYTAEKWQANNMAEFIALVARGQIMAVGTLGTRREEHIVAVIPIAPDYNNVKVYNHQARTPSGHGSVVIMTGSSAYNMADKTKSGAVGKIWVVVPMAKKSTSPQQSR
jgi:RHS repeat-associated protein